MRPIIAFVVASSFAASAFAAPIVYGNYSGTSVHFLNVTEDSTTDPLPLFGAPTLAGDSLVFNPASFGANATPLNGYIDITDGTLTTAIVAKPGQSIQQIAVSEAGDYTLAGQGPAAVTVAAILFAQIVEVDGSPIVPLNVNGLMTFTPTGNPATPNGDYALPGNAGVGVIWTGNAILNIAAALASANIEGDATKVLFSMDNQLLAIGSEGSVAFIKKKAGGVTITVPEPATLSLLAGAGLLALARRR